MHVNPLVHFVDCLTEQGESPCETRNADDAASATSSEQDVDTLSVGLHQTCRADETTTTSADVKNDLPQPSETTHETALSNDSMAKTEADSSDTQETSGSDDVADEIDPEISFKKRIEPANVDDSKKALDLNRNSEEISPDNKTTCCSA